MTRFNWLSRLLLAALFATTLVTLKAATVATIAPWFAVIIILSVVGPLLNKRISEEQGSRDTLARWEKACAAFSTVVYLVWTSAAYVYIPADDDLSELTILVFLFALNIAAFSTLLPSRPTMVASLLALNAPLALRLVLIGKPLYLVLAGAIVVATVSLIRASGAAYRRLVDNMDLSFEKSALAERLSHSNDLIRAANTDLAGREAHLTAVMNAVSDAIFTLDRRGIVVSANRGASRLYGCTSESLAGRSLFADLVAISPDARSPSVSASVLLPENGMDSLIPRDVVAHRPDGSSFEADLTVNKLRPGADAVRVAVVRDITKQKDMQRQLLQTAKLATLGQMAADVAHELNQPLNVIRMAIENALIIGESPEPDAELVRSKLHLVIGQIDRVAEIIRHLRVFSRMDRGDAVAFDAVQVVRQAVDLVRSQFGLDGIVLEDRLPRAALSVEGHPNRFEQVLINLLRNARDAVIDRHPAMSGVRRVRVSVESVSAAKQVHILVSDTGSGIAPDDIERIFDPFFTTKEAGRGTGLGLSIAQSIVSTMGGRISATNDGDGAVFRIVLPHVETVS